LGSPPAAFIFTEKNAGISPPTMSRAFLPAAMLTVFEFGVALTDKSGLPHSPALAAGWIASPRWSPWTWVSSTASILPRRGSSAPRTVRPAS
jgi:hypothetical protein